MGWYIEDETVSNDVGGKEIEDSEVTVEYLRNEEMKEMSALIYGKKVKIGIKRSEW